MTTAQCQPEIGYDEPAVELVHADDEPHGFHAAATRAAFDLFILINATLFLRPSEIVPGLGGWPIYEVLNLLCISLCFPQMMQKLRGARLAAAPVVACVVGLQFSVILTDLSHFAFDSALTSGTDFAKVLAYFLMLITVVDTPKRLRTFLLSLLIFTTVLTALALMHFHGWVNIPAMAAARDMWGDEGEGGEIMRLCAAGLYGNPNDLARILVVGMLLAMYWVMGKGSGPVRLLWIGPFLMMGYALQLTHSRGGLLALMAGLALLFKMRFGWFKSILVGFIVTPVLLVAFSGRQLEMSTSSGTGQQRIQLWAEGLSYLRGTPLFGIGMNRYQEYVGLAAHNSFVQCFVDLGFIGGTLFVSACLLSLWGAHRAGTAARTTIGGEMFRLRTYMVAIIGSSIVGMFSSTRSYTIPTYTILGIAQCYQQLVESRTGVPEVPLNGRLCRQMCCWGLRLLCSSTCTSGSLRCGNSNGMLDSGTGAGVGHHPDVQQRRLSRRSAGQRPGPDAAAEADHRD